MNKVSKFFHKKVNHSKYARKLNLQRTAKHLGIKKPYNSSDILDKLFITTMEHHKDRLMNNIFKKVIK